MPITVFRYGRASTNKQVMSPEVQAEMTLREFNHQKATGRLPEDAIDGGFYADPDTSRAVEFLKRKCGVIIAVKAKPGDRIIAAAYDRLIGSPVDCHHTLLWALNSKIDLVVMDLQLDMSTPHGKMIAQIIASVKEYERLEIGRRTKEALRHRRATGRPTGSPPIGYRNATIIPIGGGRPVKYYLPNDPIRDFCWMVVKLHDESGLSFRRMHIKFWKEKVVPPGCKANEIDRNRLERMYRAAKAGFPLHDGVQWKPPGFKFKEVKPINFDRVSA